MERQKPKIDLAVLIIFFCRDRQLKKVFEQVKCARPSKLYLYQDGPRINRPDDDIGIRKCRAIVSQIDWECEVHTFYQEKNHGCDPSEYIAQKWMFETEELGIVLEDDDVPAQAFFPFCKELLERYRNDQRIHMICGMNNLEKFMDCPYSYTFTMAGTITGWATWKRIIDEWSPEIEFVNDEYATRLFSERYRKRPYKNPVNVLKHYKQCNMSGVSYYESILNGNALSQNRLAIVPTYNMICNIGVTQNATHSVSSLKMLPKGIRKIFEMKTYEITFPLHHPPFVIEDVVYLKKLYRVMGYNHPFVHAYRKVESVILRLRHGDSIGLWKSLKVALGLRDSK